MKTVFTGLLLAAGLFAQTTADKPPTYVGAGAAFNQIGTPRVNIWATAVFPVVSKIGLYSSTTTDIIPVLRFDPATGRQYYGFSTSVRQGVHKLLYRSEKFAVLGGGDAGVEVNQSVPSGVAVSMAGSVTGTVVYQLGKKWSVMVPIRALWQNGAWNLVPQIGVMFRP